MLLAGLLLVAGCGNSAVAAMMRLTKAEGTVEIEDGEGKDISITEDMKLYSGYHVDTKSKSYAWISLDEVKLVKLDEDSDAQLRKDGGKLELLVNSGSLFFHITEPLGEEESLDIRTSSMSIGIRGTCGWVHTVDERHVQVYILEGIVQCEAVEPSSGEKAESDVSAGEMAEMFADPGAKEGDKCGVAKKKFSIQDIPDFVLEEVDPESFGLDSAEELEEDVLIPLFQTSEYEGFGMAKNGVMPAQKNGLWGAVDYGNEVIVPFEYTGFQAPDETGNFVLINTVVEERTENFGEEVYTYEVEQNSYTLFDRQGNILYQGQDPVRAGGGMYLLLKKGEEPWLVEYYRLDGTLVQSLEMSSIASTFNGFYDGISMVYRRSYENAAVIGEEEHVGYTYSTGTYQVGELKENGEITWHEDPLYLEYLRINEEILQEAIRDANTPNHSGWEMNGAGHSSYTPRVPLCTGNHGYYLAGNFEVDAGLIALCDENYQLVGECYIDQFQPDPEQGFVRAEGYFAENNSFRGFYHDGAYFYNYGPNMVLILGDQDVLVDFSRYPGMTMENADNRIVKAVYDKIYMSDEKYWIVKKGEKWGYIDHDGREAAMFDDVSNFYSQYTLVLEDGKAYLINEEFEKLQDLGEADSVGVYGELFAIGKGNTSYFYRLK